MCVYMNPSLSLRYCLPQGLWIVHFWVAQEIPNWNLLWVRCGSPVCMSPVWEAGTEETRHTGVRWGGGGRRARNDSRSRGKRHLTLNTVSVTIGVVLWVAVSRSHGVTLGLKHVLNADPPQQQVFYSGSSYLAGVGAGLALGTVEGMQKAATLQVYLTQIVIKGFEKVNSPTKSSTYCLTISLTILS